MRVATYNIRHASLKGLGAIRTVLDTLGADLVGLQEVDRNVLRSGGEDQTRLLGEALGMEARFGPAMRLDGGEYGLALLSRYPIASFRVHRLPSQVEPRIVLHGTVEVPDGPPWEVAVTHLGLHPLERWEQMREILRLFWRSERILLLGDLNEGRTEFGFGLLRAHWVDCLEEAGADFCTYPAEHPAIGIDHVLRSRDLPPATLARAISTQASDHLPVAVELG